MSRISQFVWPVLALVASFSATFLCTWAFSQPTSQPVDEPASDTSIAPTPTPTPTPEPSDYGMVIEAHGVHLPRIDSPPATWSTEKVLEYGDGQVCLAGTLTQDGWRPDDAVVWTRVADTWCRPIAPNELIDVRFVR